MAFTIQRNTSPSALCGSHHSPSQYNVAKAAHYEEKHTAGLFSPSSPIHASPPSRCSSASSELSFCSLNTPAASSDSGHDEDGDEDHDFDYDYDFDEDDDESEEDEDDEMVVVELVSILKKPRDLLHSSSLCNGMVDDEDTEEGSECDVVFERNVTFTEPLATDMETGDIVQPSKLSRQEWTAMKLRESIERNLFLVDCKSGMSADIAEGTQEDSDDEENGKQTHNDIKASDEEMRDDDDEEEEESDSDVELDDEMIEDLVLEFVDTTMCHTQIESQTEMRHRSAIPIVGAGL
ncbi:hypothetical protein F5Y17DRAFT_282146 [Xylariaceae sp. FL0594]|nr:hypothetical protein F5Y17DRAFT_282146 [Xylariaceae sp. FL0594]